MKKQRRKNSTKKKQATPAPAATSRAPDRRQILRYAKAAAIGLPVIGIAGYFTTQAVEASICEIDLSKIGSGLPAIVQIHDPSCAQCRTLQTQTRRAMRPFDDDAFHYLVANINTVEGSTLANRHGVSHVTLLFFDGDGVLLDVLRGPTGPDHVRTVVERHIGHLT